jgi:hypothetical protein
VQEVPESDESDESDDFDDYEKVIPSKDIIIHSPGVFSFQLLSCFSVFSYF